MYCICRTCERYSKYSQEDYTCEQGHFQTKTAFYTDENSTEYIFQCPSGCPGGAEYLHERCTECDETFEKIQKPDKTTNVEKPHNYVVLYTKEDIEKDKQHIPQREVWNEDNRTDPVCPCCGEQNASSFVLDEQGIRSLGLTPDPNEGGFSTEDIAPVGACPTDSCIKEMYPGSLYRWGVPLVIRQKRDDELKETGYDVRGTGDYIGMMCQICRRGTYEPGKEDYPTCTACGHEVSLVFDQKEGRQGKGEKYYKFRNKYLKALENRRSIVDPPYYFVSAQNPFASPPPSAKVKKKQPEEMASSSKHANEWYHCLEPYLTKLEPTSASLLEQIIAAAYINKTFDRRHIEPIWMFAERQGVGNKINRAFVFASQQRAVFEKTILDNPDALEPTKMSLKIVYTLIKDGFGNLWPLSNNGDNGTETDEGILDNAMKGLGLLKTSGYLKKFTETKMLREPYALGGLMESAAGLVEVMCILWSVRKKNENHYKELAYKVFPDTKNAYWRGMMSEIGIQVIIGKEKIFSKMDKQENS